MKPFTLLLIFLGLILGLWVLARYHSLELDAPEDPATPVQVQLQSAPAERDFGPDGEDAREEAEGLPVPIIPGTRVTEARIVLPDAAGAGTQKPMPPSVLYRPARGVRLSGALSSVRSVSGRLSATVERARDDARLQLEHEVTEWLTPEVPTQWKPPGYLISRMIHKTDVHPIVRDYGTVYEATLQTDFSSNARGAIVAAHQREVVGRRLVTLGGSLGFVLVCLAALAGYIRADEATKGYYTHWLRAIAAAGVGASGVVIYQLLT
jgi:hypothetical protein